MKKLYFAFILFSASFISFSQSVQSSGVELFGNEADDFWQGAEHIWLKQENTVPAFVQFRPGSEPDEKGFFAYLKMKFILPPYYNFELIGNEADQIGYEHKRFQITVNNFPVTNGVFLLHLQNGKVKKYNGYLFKNISLFTSPSLNESAALTRALTEVSAETYKWQLPVEEEFLKLESGDTAATFFPKGELEILQVGENTSTVFRLVWKFDIYAHQPMSRQYIYVDAETGEVLKKTNRICHANTTGTATTVYRGNRTIVADSYNGAYRLYETTRGLGVRTRNMLTGTTYGNAVEFTDANNIWNNVNAALDQYAGDAHWGAEMTYDFYQTMGRNSINGNGLLLNLYVHYDVDYVNAFWDGARMTFGDGNATYDPLVTLDITGHEITHGLDEYTANLDYQDEPGALNESFSDIFGAAVEWYADSTRADWTIGEDIGGAFRSMSNPNSYGDPDTYFGNNWYTGTGDYGGVHTNSSVQNHWYYRLVQGGSGTNDIGNTFNIPAIGRTKATQIAWRNMVNYLTNTSNYADSRFYAIQSANDLFGACSQEVVSTTKAWYAVGVGADYSAGADAQFSASPLTGCALPFTVNFTNTSSNASSYTWYFGDGNSSTATNPSHTYTANGIYTVKLVANGGGTCGSDSVIYTNLINVSNTNPCVVILPTSGTYQIQTSCNGVIYDNGGANGNYSNNTSSTITIAPVGASQVRLHFTQLRTEVNYDYVYVYDGPTTASPVIGSYTGTTLPADITSSGSSITVRQFSDQYVVDSGFTIQWTCITPNNPPVANFSADVTQSCTGVIKFTDLTTGGANSWLWNFGDGTTSTQQHPTHVYQTNGTFTVSLFATNTFGNNTVIKISYIVISKPAGPSVTNPSSCGASSFSLGAAETNPVTWFDSSGNVVSSSNPFVTPVLNSSRTYYVQDTQPQLIYKVGPVSNAIGTGSYFNGTQNLGLRFRVNKTSTLVSVLVYAQTAGYRTVQYRDSLGGVITNKTVYIPAGSSRITLNIDLIAGGPYELGLRDTLNLYRNNAGAVYPYNDANGIVSIIGNNANGVPAYYYFFYDWEVKEKDCISLKVPVTATVNPVVTASSSSTNVSCNGGTNGSVSVTPVGGTPNFTYHWNNNASISNLSNVAAGTYTITITDAVGCSVSASRIITQPTALVPSATVTNVLCNGGNTGAITLAVTGGTASYSYNWGSGVTSQSRTLLSAGTYTVTVTDANMCTATSSSTVTQPTALVPSMAVTNVLCNGGNTGAITLAVTGGTTTYSYNWGGGITSQNRISLGAGTYNVTVTDANLCTATISSIVTQPAAISASVSPVSTTCNLNNGTASAFATGGTPTYSYVWSNGQTSSSVSNLVAGTYNLTVTDNNLCSVTSSVIINSSLALSVTGLTLDVNCNGSNDGSAAINVTNATQPIFYFWSNGTNASSINNVGAGNYSVTVIDAQGCSATASQTISEPTALNLSVTLTDASCGGSNGSAVSDITGGTQGYYYLWSNGETSSDISNLSAGNYSVTVTDSHNCSTFSSVTIANTANINADVSSIDASCFGVADGTACVTVTNGTQPFTYIWSNGDSTANISNLTPGNYSVTVNDVNNCSFDSTVTISEPTELVVNINSSDVLCFGEQNGTAVVIASGGTPGYTYLWCNGSNSSSAQNLAVGICDVTITDQNGCAKIASASISQPNTITFSTASSNADIGQSNGSASLDSLNGGVAPYSFAWSNGSDTQNILNVPSGTYSVTITDNNGCSQTANITIQENPSATDDVNAELSFTVYPNPASTELFVRVSPLNETERVLLSMRNVLGQTILSRRISSFVTNINTSLIPSGVYFLEIKSGQKVSVKEIVVSR